MSEVEQVPPQGPEGPPVRPPSPPSRVARLIWAAIALFCLITFGTALALFFWSRENMGSRDLKKATSVTIGYTLKGPERKTVTISDPAEVRALLDSLEITNTYPGAQAGIAPAGWVEFTLSNGKVARCVFMNQTNLDRAQWGQVWVTPRFYQKVCDEASKAEGRRIDVLNFNN